MLPRLSIPGVTVERKRWTQAQTSPRFRRLGGDTLREGAALITAALRGEDAMVAQGEVELPGETPLRAVAEAATRAAVGGAHPISSEGRAVQLEDNWSLVDCGRSGLIPRYIVNRLVRARIRTVGDVRRWGLERLRVVPGMGARSLLALVEHGVVDAPGQHADHTSGQRNFPAPPLPHHRATRLAARFQSPSPPARSADRQDVDLVLPRVARRWRRSYVGSAANPARAAYLNGSHTIDHCATSSGAPWRVTWDDPPAGSSMATIVSHHRTLAAAKTRAARDLSGDIVRWRLEGIGGVVEIGRARGSTSRRWRVELQPLHFRAHDAASMAKALVMLAQTVYPSQPERGRRRLPCPDGGAVEIVLGDEPTNSHVSVLRRPDDSGDESEVVCWTGEEWESSPSAIEATLDAIGLAVDRGAGMVARRRHARTDRPVLQ